MDLQVAYGNILKEFGLTAEAYDEIPLTGYPVVGTMKTEYGYYLVRTSGNAELIQVNKGKDLYKALESAGGRKVTITAIAKDGSGVKGTYKITSVKGTVKKITITGSKTTLKAGKSLKLKAKVTASKGAYKKVIWTSSNTKYAKVTASGKVRTYRAGKGKKVKITARAADGSGKKKTVTIKLK